MKTALFMRSTQISLISALLTLSCGKANQDSQLSEAPTGDNSIHWFGLSPMQYDDLPSEARLSKMPWPGDYWATTMGGIGKRWLEEGHGRDYKDFLYNIPTKDEVVSFESDRINRLSPAEKYDIWLGRKNLNSNSSVTGYQRSFMLQAAEFNRQNFGKDEIPGWTGICNGWSLAAIYEEQPQKPVSVTNETGQEITFYTGDIKALLSQLYFDYQPVVTVNRLGSMCTDSSPETDSEGRVEDSNCRDVNPAAFHQALAGYIAKDKPFVFDVESKDEVWNQPVYGYKLELGEVRDIDDSYQHAARGTKKLVNVAVTLEYIVEGHPQKSGYNDSQLSRFISTKDYGYTLELDSNNVILGGEWARGSSIPDFMWRPQSKPTDELLKRIRSDYPIMYTKVKELLDLSISTESNEIGNQDDTAEEDPNNSQDSSDASNTEPAEEETETEEEVEEEDTTNNSDEDEEEYEDEDEEEYEDEDESDPFDFYSIDD